MGTSLIFNLKGVILFELPGPRLLLMKANVLAVMPELKSTAEGTFLAVLDLDFGRGTLTIGLQIDFDVEPLVRIKVPAEAFFNFNDTNDWHLDLGRYIDPVQAKVLQIFDASGYLMLSGSGISGIPNLPAVTGFSVAAGLHVSFTWGGGPLFARLAAALDAIVGFAPFRLAGILSVRGTLHLFIVDIGAWAELQVAVGDDSAGGKVARIDGKICGRVEFLFFAVEGCLDFALGDDSVPIPDPPDLVKSLKLVSRSPALVLGTGVDKPIDCGIGDGVRRYYPTGQVTGGADRRHPDAVDGDSTAAGSGLEVPGPGPRRDTRSDLRWLDTARRRFLPVHPHRHRVDRPIDRRDDASNVVEAEDRRRGPGGATGVAELGARSDAEGGGF